MKTYTPTKLYEELSQTIMFQDEYLQTLATTLWLHDIRIKTLKYINPLKNTIPPKNNLLIVGPTGSGKTLALQTISKLLKYDLLITNFASFTGAGWKGRDVEEIIKDLYNICDRDIERTERGIIFLAHCKGRFVQYHLVLQANILLVFLQSLFCILRDLFQKILLS